MHSEQLSGLHLENFVFGDQIGYEQMEDKKGI